MTEQPRLSATLEHNQVVRDRYPSKRKNHRTVLKERSLKAKEKRLNVGRVFQAPLANLSVYSKAVSDPNKPYNEEDPDRALSRLLDDRHQIVNTVYKSIICTKNNSKSIKEMFPDVAMATNIIVAGFTSPTSLKDNHINIALEEDFLSGAPSVKSGITKKIYNELDNYYEFIDTIPEIYEESIAGSGAKPHLFISEAIMDDIINAEDLSNVSLEEFKTLYDHNVNVLAGPLGILQKQKEEDSITIEGLKESPTLENFVKYLSSDKYFNITDNVGVCRLGELKEDLRANVLRSTLRKGRGIATESVEKIRYTDLFRNPTNPMNDKSVQIIKDKLSASRKPIGRAIYRVLPTESVIPVFVPGTPGKHVGYIVLLDENSTPLTGTISQTSFNRMNDTLHSKGSGNAISQVYRDLVSGTGNNGKCGDVHELFDLHKEVVEKQILDAFRSSLYGDYVEIANVEEVSLILLYRALSGQRTNALYVPAEGIVYFALKFNEFGVGKTLLEDHYVTFSMRSLARFASIMGYIRSAIDVTDVDVELDPRDPNAEESVEMITKLVMDSRNSQFPLGTIEPHDLMTWIQRMGLNFNFRNHADLPNVNITYTRSNVGASNGPDPEYEDMLAEETALGLMVSPDTIRASLSADFAYEAKLNNEFFNRRSRILQKVASKDLTKFASLIFFNDEVLRKEVREILEKNIDVVKESITEEEVSLLDKDQDRFYETFLDKISERLIVTLPDIPEANPDATRNEFDKFIEELDTILDIMFDATLYESGDAGALVEKLDFWKTNVRVQKIKEWAGKNSYRPEIFNSLADNTKAVDTIVATMKEYYIGTNKQIVGLLDGLLNVKESTNQDLKRIISEGGSEEEEDMGY